MTAYQPVRVVLCVVGMAIGGSQADAQVVSETAPPAAEVTPFVALGSDFSSRIGAAISFAWTQNFDVEAEVGYRQNEMHALGASVNLLYAIPRLGRIAPYVAAGVGLEQYGTPIEVPTFGVLTRRNIGISTNVGGGVKVPINDRWAFRSDARWLNPWGNVPEGWRLYSGATLGVGKR